MPLKRLKKRKSVINVSQRPKATNPSHRPKATNPSHRRAACNPSTTPLRRPNPLPSQYNFTLAAQAPLTPLSQGQVPIVPQQSTTAQHIGSYPPPQQLFESIPPLSTREEFPNPSYEEVHINHFPHQSAPLEDPHGSQLHTSHGHSHPSSQGNNFEQDESLLPDLEEDTLRALNALLRVPDWEMFTTLLSPTPMPKSTWFTRDQGSKLVRAITKVFTNKFDGPFYTWSCVPRERQENNFLEFAKTHTCDPLITGTVQQYFEEICNRRMKDMVSGVRTSLQRPKWINETLWKSMTTYWETEEAQKRSQTYSDVCMSECGGLSPHVHLSGPKSYNQIQQELAEKLGREVSLGEVFIKTHTKPDGTYVDKKAEK